MYLVLKEYYDGLKRKLEMCLRHPKIDEPESSPAKIAERTMETMVKLENIAEDHGWHCRIDSDSRNPRFFRSV